MMTAFASQAQSLSVTPHINFQYAASRVADNASGYSTFNSKRFSSLGAGLGVWLEYRSSKKWGGVTGISPGSIGLGYEVSYSKEGGIPFSKEVYIVSTHNTLWRVPILLTYNWRNVRLFKLRRYKNLPVEHQPEATDDDIFYSLRFKVQPIAGVNLNYIGKKHRWGTPEDTLNNRFAGTYIDLYYPTEELSRVNVSASAGVRLQFYSQDKDHLALTVLYHQGFSDLLEMEVNYTIDGDGPYRSYVRTRGSGLSVTLSYPIQIYNFNKEERKLRRQSK